MCKLSFLIIGKAQSHNTLHADVLGSSCACSITASSVIFCFSESGPVVSRTKVDLKGALDTALHLKGGGVALGLSPARVRMESAFRSYRCLEVQEIHLFHW